MDGRKVTVEHTMTGIYGSVDGGECKPITSETYMKLVAASV